MFVKPAVLNLCYFNILMFRDLSGLCSAFLLHENALVSLGFDIGILNRIDSMLSCFCGSAIDHRRPLRREMADRLAKFTRKIIIRSKIIHPMIEKYKLSINKETDSTSRMNKVWSFPFLSFLYRTDELLSYPDPVKPYVFLNCQVLIYVQFRNKTLDFKPLWRICVTIYKPFISSPLSFLRYARNSYWSTANLFICSDCSLPRGRS